MVRVSRVARVFPVVVLAAVVAGCGGSHKAVPTTTTQPVDTVPKATRELVVRNFPTELAGSLTFNIDRREGNPRKPGGSRRKYKVTLEHLLFRLAGVQGKGAQRQARYSLVSAHETFTGSEDRTSPRCKTTHIVWAGSGSPPTGTVEVFGPNFDAVVGFVILIPQRGRTLTRPCTAPSGGTKGSTVRIARIQGNANLKLTASKVPTDRFSIGIEIESSTAGPDSSGGYTINGTLTPPATGNPVQLCRQEGKKLTCPA
jgi:hypothetical protein